MVHERAVVLATVVSVAVSFLTVCAPGAAAALPSGSATLGSGSWAYGTVRTVTATGQGGLYDYQVTAVAGFAVILNETTTSSGNFTLQVHRAMGLLLSVVYCRPSCTHPTETATVRYHTWETVNASVNLTTSASVSTSGGTLPALGVTSSTLELGVRLTLTTAVTLNGVEVRTRNLSVDFTASTANTFAPSLGLLPLNLSQADSWNSTSTFSQTGAAKWSILDVRTGGLTPGTVDRSGNLSLARSGTITLSGDNSGSTVRLGGKQYDVVNLTVAKGPFDLREGFLLIPTAADLFGGGAPSWLTSNANDTGSANVSQANIDVTGSLTSSGHLGFIGSGVWWRSATSNPASGAASVAENGAAPAVSSAAVGTNATYLQGGPMSVGQATTDQKCVATGLACPAGSGSRGYLGTVLVLTGVGAAVVIAVGLVVARRRVPPPPYPNASLYPPGRTGGSPPTPPPRPAGPPSPPAEDDPLGHLW